VYSYGAEVLCKSPTSEIISKGRSTKAPKLTSAGLDSSSGHRYITREVTGICSNPLNENHIKGKRDKMAESFLR